MEENKLTRLQNTIFLKDRIYIPKNLVQDPSLLSYWVHRLYDEAMCKRCDNLPARHNAQCNTCPGYKKPAIKMWSDMEGSNGIDYYCLPIGFIEKNLKVLKIDTSKVIIEDKRCNKKFDSNLQFTGKLREGELIDGIPTANQKYLVDKWLEKGHGVIQSPTRSGKTCIFTAIACKLGVKTLIVAHQTELLENFYKTFESLTNVKELREHSGKTIVKIINDIEDLEKEDLDVALVNYQKFIRKESGQERIEKLLKGKFGLLGVDECFPKGTQVKTLGGEKNIEDIVVGDLVYSDCLDKSNSYEVELKRVSNVWKKKTAKKLIQLKHIFGEVLCTEDHKIYCVNKQEWRAALRFELGDTIKYFNEQTQEYKSSEVNSTMLLDITDDYVYDIEVEDNHNYFAEGVLVHNCHQGNATCFAKFIKALDVRYRCGLSATPHRKDCLEENTKLYTNNGILTIKEIIEEYQKDKEDILVWSKNLETGEMELKPILEVHKISTDNKELIKVNDSFICTKDHEFI